MNDKLIPPCYQPRSWYILRRIFCTHQIWFILRIPPVGFTAIATLFSFSSSVFPPPLPLEDYLWNYDYVPVCGFLISWKGGKQPGLDNGRLPRLVQEFWVLILSLLATKMEELWASAPSSVSWRGWTPGLQRPFELCDSVIWHRNFCCQFFRRFWRFSFSNPWLWTKSNIKTGWLSYHRYSL